MVSHVRSARLLALQKRAAGWLPALLAAAPIAVPVLLLAHAALGAVLDRTQGVPAVPLDDAYIHFQYARSFATGEPLEYAPGEPPVAGATSLLWPLALALPYALGLRDQSIVWAAWCLGFAALGLLAHEARRAALVLSGPVAAASASVLVLAFGANTWFAASGMEVVPLAWLLLRAARRSAEWCEGAPDGPSRRELVLLALILPLLRPEGALGSVLIAASLVALPRGARRSHALLALVGLVLPSLIQLALTGDAASTTARSKWLPLNPYATPASLFTAFVDYAHLLVGTLLNGEIWSALFLPRGSAPFALAAFAALPIAGVRRGARARAALLAALGAGILIPATYDCPLCNRLRYLWPFIPAWLVGAAVLGELVGDLLAEWKSELRVGGLILIGAFAGALAAYVPFALDDLATSARAILDQQVSLGRWAGSALPRSARIGVNDTGAIAYFSGRKTFDVVGLTTPGEARYWTAGPGSRFEHYERLGAERLPSHFIVYPEWFALDDLLGPALTERYVPDASILGGERMVAYEASYALLGSGERPDAELAAGRALVDRLDVADLESEASHSYRLFEATQRDNVLLASGELRDAGRASRSREAFVLELRAGGAIQARVAADTPTTLRVQLSGRRFTLEVPASGWHEARLDLPRDLAPGRHAVSVESGDGGFTSLHYFSLSAPP